jgi:cell wall-associated NlpC family hydrolase
VKAGQIGKQVIRGCAMMMLCAGLTVAVPGESQAAVKTAEVQTRSSYTVTIEAPEVEVHQSASLSSKTQGMVKRGQSYEVLDSGTKGWVKIRTGGREGYIKTAGNATVVERAKKTVNESAKKRRQTVEFALQFVGNPYVYGGTDPNRGADCSGFTRYIMEHMASISLPHSAAGQSGFGQEVAEEDMQPGDLIFYSQNGSINHVALYIGNGQVVHASTEKTGIRTSVYDYREPVKIVSLLS